MHSAIAVKIVGSIIIIIIIIFAKAYRATLENAVSGHVLGLSMLVF